MFKGLKTTGGNINEKSLVLMVIKASREMLECWSLFVYFY